MRKPTVIVFYPHNPFTPLHGSHQRCLQQLQDLCNDYKIVFVSSSGLSDTTWPSNNSILQKISNDHKIAKILIFERTPIGVISKFFIVPAKILYRLVPIPLLGRLKKRLIRVFYSKWLESVALRFQSSAVIIHYTNWSYLSRIDAGGIKVLELHDLIPVNQYLSEKVINMLETDSLCESLKASESIGYINNIIDVPTDVVKKLHQEVAQINTFDLAWMISHREERLLREVGMNIKSDIIYPLVTCSATHSERNSPAILPVGPNAFNTYSLQSFINDVIPLFDAEVSAKNEINVTGRLWGDRKISMPHPLNYLGIVSQYEDLLSRSAFMIAPTFVGTGQQIKLFEALAFGIPVIAYTCAVPPDILSGNPSIIGVNSPKELAEMICRLWNDKYLLQHYWDLASEAAEREVERRKLYPYSNSLKYALSCHDLSSK